MKADFSRFGAKSAFPGDLRMSWGACLVEPPSIGALRKQAESKLVRLGTLAPPRFGIPTRVVGYFCVEELDEPDTLHKLGIRSQRDRQRYMAVRDGRGAVHTLERDALKPMVRRAGVLEGRINIDANMTAPWHMLYLSDDRAELEAKRWERTLAYIRYGETQDFPAGENSRRAGGVPAQRSQVRVRPVWFQVPRIPTDEGRVCWFIGRNERHYAPTLAKDILVPNNFLYSVPPPNIKHSRAFAAVSNLSWAHLMVEINGRRGAGDGVLHTYVRDLHKVPLIDPRKLTSSEAADLVGLFDTVAKRPALNIREELLQPDRQALDRWAMRYLFGDDAVEAARAVDFALRELVDERIQRAASGRAQAQKAVRRTRFDPAPVAARILIDRGVPPQVMEMLEESVSGKEFTMHVEVPRHEPGLPSVGSTLLDQGHVVVGEVSLFEAPTDAHASAIVAHLTANSGFSGELTMPSDPGLVNEVSIKWEQAMKKWVSDTRDAIRAALPRPQHNMRRVQVLREVEQQAHLAPGLLGEV